MGIFKDVISGKKTSRPPVWFMRQAGRVLPSYLKLKENYSFKELMENPELAAKVTLLPVEDLGVDAAILFSDILVIPEALGMKLNFTDKGPAFDSPLHDAIKQVKGLHTDTKKLEHIYKTLDIIVKDKPKETGLIGFCGAPFTTFCYMVHGNSANNTFEEAIKLIYSDWKTSEYLFEQITELSIEYATKQTEHGIDLFQLFDTHAGLIPYELMIEKILPYVKRICNAVRAKGVPVIYFPKGIGHGIRHINYDTADYVSVDWQSSLTEVRNITDNNIGLQGNLDPRILSVDDKSIIEENLNKNYEFGTKNYNWIFNTGHGLMPDNKFENIKFVIDWIKNKNWDR